MASKESSPAPRQLPNTTKSITTHPEGDIESKFNKAHLKSRSLRMPPINQPLIPPRFCFSNPIARLSGVKTDLKIPQTSYTETQKETIQQQQPSPLSSPTYS